jgi:hypothetical protein
MNIYLIIYVVVSAAIVLGGTMKLYNDRMIAAGVFGLGSAAVAILYGLRWFSSSNSIFSQAPVNWPPSMNTCPDYLTYYEVKDTSGTVTAKTCIDTVGVSKNGNMTKWPTDGTTPAYSESSTSYFTLTTKATDPEAKKKEWCWKAIQAGLTWEGVTNGEACITADGGTSGPSDPSKTSSCSQ